MSFHLDTPVNGLNGLKTEVPNVQPMPPKRKKPAHGYFPMGRLFFVACWCGFSAAARYFPGQNVALYPLMARQAQHVTRFDP